MLLNQFISRSLLGYPFDLMCFASEALPFLLHLDHELADAKSAKEASADVGGRGEGRAVALGSLHSPSGKEHPEAGARGPGASEQGTGRDRDVTLVRCPDPTPKGFLQALSPVNVATKGSIHNMRGTRCLGRCVLG